MAWGPKDAKDIRRDVIVFDGDCVLCSRMATTVHRADPDGRIAEIYKQIARRVAVKIAEQAKEMSGKFPNIVVQNT